LKRAQRKHLYKYHSGEAVFVRKELLSEVNAEKNDSDSKKNAISNPVESEESLSQSEESGPHDPNLRFSVVATKSYAYPNFGVHGRGPLETSTPKGFLWLRIGASTSRNFNGDGTQEDHGTQLSLADNSNNTRFLDTYWTHLQSDPFSVLYRFDPHSVRAEQLGCIRKVMEKLKLQLGDVQLQDLEGVEDKGPEGTDDAGDNENNPTGHDEGKESKESSNTTKSQNDVSANEASKATNNITNNIPNNIPSLVMGDFNITAETEEMRNCTENLGLETANWVVRESNFVGGTRTTDRTNEKKRKQGAKQHSKTLPKLTTQGQPGNTSHGWLIWKVEELMWDHYNAQIDHCIAGSEVGVEESKGIRFTGIII
jgi:hypothetical protein